MTLLLTKSGRVVTNNIQNRSKVYNKRYELSCYNLGLKV